MKFVLFCHQLMPNNINLKYKIDQNIYTVRTVVLAQCNINVPAAAGSVSVWWLRSLLRVGQLDLTTPS